MTQAAVLAQMGNTNQTFRNRIINGAMMIDQRNAGASVTVSADNSLTLDRWKSRCEASLFSTYSVQQSSTAPTGFVNSLLVTSLSAASIGSTAFASQEQRIEGLNMSDFGWGSVSAAPITISFWVRSSLTGTFGGYVQNSAQNRVYVFTYAISSANTWEQKTVTIAGDTSGTWLTTNGIGLRLGWNLGTGTSVSGTAGSWGSTNYYSATSSVNMLATNGATFYITGVQLEVGTKATPFEQRLYGTELALCYRYYWKQSAQVAYTFLQTGVAADATSGVFPVPFPVTMRAAPTFTSSGSFRDYTGTAYAVSAIALNTYVSQFNGTINTTHSSGTSAGQGLLFGANNDANAYIAYSAEL